MEIINYINPELLALIPVLYLIGAALKKSESVPDKRIPLILGLCGILLAVLWVLSTTIITDYQTALTAAFTAIVQGVLCAGASVYANQVVKQGGKQDE